MKVITFSRTFPSYHPRKGQPTYFVEKFLNGLIQLGLDGMDDPLPSWSNEFCESIKNDIKETKHHTIRAGKRWKVGDKFSPRVWSGKPYNSKQIIIAPDIEIKNVWNFEIKIIEVDGGFASKVFINDKRVSPDLLIEIAVNDGLLLEDFLSWFKYPKDFSGQVICWNNKISY
jgi:hypothetical protein